MINEPISFFIAHKKTVFIPLRFVYPECFKLIEPHEQMYPVRCLIEDGCPANMNCMEYLVQRVKYIFDEVVPNQVEMMVAYYRYRDRNSIRAAIFHRDLREPRVIIVNPWGFKKMQKESETFQWKPTEEYKNIGAYRGIIPVENLIRVS